MQVRQVVFYALQLRQGSEQNSQVTLSTDIMFYGHV